MRFVKGILTFIVILFSIAGPGFAADEQIAVSVSPGSYGDDQRVYLSTSIENGEIYYSFIQETNLEPIKYVVPFTLSALTGELRTYRLHAELKSEGDIVFRQEYEYIIDKQKPELPKLNLPEGQYDTNIELTFTKAKGEDIYFSFNAPISGNSILWDGTPLMLTAETGSFSEYVIWAYARDTAGNTSPVGKWAFTVGKRKISIPDPVLDVLSPVEGIFLNPQFLVVNWSGMEWVRYTENISGIEKDYTDPVEIAATGEVTLTVRGKSLKNGEILEKRIFYKVQPSDAISSIAKNGVFSSQVSVSITSELPVFYCFDERSPLPFDGKYKEPIVLKPITGGLRYITLRMAALEPSLQNDSASRNESGSKGELRYFFVMDDRIPPPPSITLKKNVPLSGPTEVAVQGSELFPIYYTLDGSSPDKASNQYASPFILTIPDKGEGFATIRAKSISKTGKESEQVTKLIPFDTQPPKMPEVIAKRAPAGGSASITVSGDKNTAVLYSISYSEKKPAEINSSSFLGKSDMVISAPFGMDTQVTMRIALMDEGGNISESVTLSPFVLSNRPQPPPQFEYLSGIVRIKGEGSTFYTLSDSGQVPPVPDLSSNIYEHPLFLSGKKNQLTRYVLRAISVNEFGTSSSVSEPFTFSIDLREPLIPAFRGIENGGIYNNPQPELRFDNIVPDLTIFYTFTTDGTLPEDPTPGSFSTTQSIRFSSKEGEDIYYNLKVMPGFPDADRYGAIVNLSFIVDRRPPTMPVLRGIEQGGFYNKSVPVTAVKGDDADTIFLSLSFNGEEPPDPLGPQGIVYTKPVFVDISDNTESVISIKTSAKDRADNITANPETYRFTVDRLPPLQPVLLTKDTKGISKDPVPVNFNQITGETIYYELTSDMKVPAIPTQSSTKYIEPFYLTGKENSEITYNLSAIAQDKAGNINKTPIRFTYIIDKKAPDNPGSPQIFSTSDDDDSGAVTYFVAWSLSRETSIFYSIGNSNYYGYSEPFRVRLTPDQEDELVTYYAEDKAGNRSSSQYQVLLSPPVKPEKLLTAISDKGVYSDALIVQSPSPYGIVRYELGTSRMPPVAVHQFSPVLENSLSVDVSPGETKTYILAMKQYRDAQDAAGFPEERKTFTIDRTPPLPPVISGVANRTFYQEDKALRISTEEGFIYYSLSESDEINGGNTDTNYKNYQGPIQLTAPKGGFRSFTISTYTVDEVGNKSAVIGPYQVYIDKEIIYVSSSTGSDLYEGTRKRPYKTLFKAISVSIETGRKKIFLDSSVYSLNLSLSISEDITIAGGYDGETWEKVGDDPTVLTPGKLFPEGNPLISVTAGKVTLTDMTLTDTMGLSGSLFEALSGDTILRNVSIVPGKNTKAFSVLHSGGNLTLVKSMVHMDSTSSQPGIAVDGGVFVLDGCTIDRALSAPGLPLIRFSRGAKAKLQKSEFSTGTSDIVSCIQSTNADLEIDGCTIFVGKGSIAANALNLTGGLVLISNTSITGDKDSTTVTMIRAEDSIIKTDGLSVEANGLNGITGFYVTNSTFNMERTRILIGKSSGYAQIFRFIGVSGTVETSTITAQISADMTGCLLTASSVLVSNNTFVFDGGSRNLLAFQISQNNKSAVNHNTIVLNGGRVNSQTAIESETLFPVQFNNFYGWPELFKGVSGVQVSLFDLNNLDGNSEGGIVHGNISVKPVLDSQR